MARKKVQKTIQSESHQKYQENKFKKYRTRHTNSQETLEFSDAPRQPKRARNKQPSQLNLSLQRAQIPNQKNTSSSIFELFERIRIKNNVYEDEINKSMIISFFLEHADYFRVSRGPNRRRSM